MISCHHWYNNMSYGKGPTLANLILTKGEKPTSSGPGWTVLWLPWILNSLTRWRLYGEAESLGPHWPRGWAARPSVLSWVLTRELHFIFSSLPILTKCQQSADFQEQCLWPSKYLRKKTKLPGGPLNTVVSIQTLTSLDSKVLLPSLSFQTVPEIRNLEYAAN